MPLEGVATRNGAGSPAAPPVGAGSSGAIGTPCERLIAARLTGSLENPSPDIRTRGLLARVVDRTGAEPAIQPLAVAAGRVAVLLAT